MATVTLQSFNVFLAERLSAAALDIYGFVEQTLTDYQEEVNRAKLENQRLQRLLDLVYKPEIRLHKEDSRQTNLSTWNLELCVQEKQIQTECFPKEEPEDTYTLTPVVPVEENEENQMPQRLTKVEKGGEHGDYEAPHDPTQVITDGEQSQHEEKSQHEAAPPPPPPFPGFTKNKKTFNCNICSQTFRKRAKANLHLAVHEANGSLKPVSTGLICIDCGKRTKTKSKMITHMRAHAQNNSFPCSICGKIYKCKSNMKEHLQTHTVERLYSCDICGKHFKRSTTLSKHVQVKHRENTVFKCTQCSQCFAVVPELKKHIRKAHSSA